jgi:NADH-quinone oxidoreductase subunit H
MLEANLMLLLKTLLQMGITIGVLLVCVAYLTLFERKIIASMQIRKGPNVNGPFGLLQPLLDGVKLLLKEPIVPANANKILFFIAPMITFSLAVMAWAVIPFGGFSAISNINAGVMYLLAISSLGVYGIIIAGWASGSNYPFLGAMRSVSQMISYEVSMGLVLISVILMSGTLNLKQIVMAQQDLWYVVPLFPAFLIFFISTVAETNRHPFDLPEAEAELVAGFNVEYSSMGFAAFFLGEYANMILMSTMTTIFFLGGWLPLHQSLAFIHPFIWMVLKVSFLLFVFVWIRAALPRYRYDQLMRLGWKVFLPLSLIVVAATATFVALKTF